MADGRARRSRSARRPGSGGRRGGRPRSAWLAPAPRRATRRPFERQQQAAARRRERARARRQRLYDQVRAQQERDCHEVAALGLRRTGTPCRGAVRGGEERRRSAVSDRGHRAAPRPRRRTHGRAARRRRRSRRSRASASDRHCGRVRVQRNRAGLAQVPRRAGAPVVAERRAAPSAARRWAQGSRHRQASDDERPARGTRPAASDFVQR